MSTEVTENIGQMIRDARLKGNLTQKELGEKLSISESAVNKLENRKTAPSVTTLERVAKALGKKLIVKFD